MHCRKCGKYINHYGYWGKTKIADVCSRCQKNSGYDDWELGVED